MLPLPPPVKFYLLISLLPPTAEVNYNCGSILSKIYSTKRYLKEDNHSGSIFTLLIKEQQVHLLKISRYLLVLREYSPLTVFFLFLLFIPLPQIQRIQLGSARERNVKCATGNYSGLFVSSPFGSPDTCTK